MSNEYFPESSLIEWDNGVRQYSTKRGDTEILISYVPPNTIIEAHNHPQAQIGIILKGELLMKVGEESLLMRPLESIYISPPNIMHGGENKTNSEVIAVDIKRSKNGEDYNIKNGFFRHVHRDKKLMNIMDVQFFNADWAEIMLADIPGNGGVMPKHRHKHEQIGICIGGEYDMTIEGVDGKMLFGNSYFCGKDEFHSAINNSHKNSKSINIFIPPRYNRD